MEDPVRTLEDIVINDIHLKINPNNIEVTDERYLDTASFLRDEATYSHYGKFSSTRYSLSLSFNVLDKSDVADLVRLATELDKFPFIFIKSKRLEDYIHGSRGMSAVGNADVYGVMSYTFVQNAAYNHIVFVEISMSYFNYLPFSPGFTFVTEREVKPVGPKRPGAKEQDKKTELFSTLDLAESTQYDAFISPEVNKRLDQVFRYLDPKGIPLDHTSVLFPTFITGRTAFEIAKDIRLKARHPMVENVNWRKVYSGIVFSPTIQGEEAKAEQVVSQEDELYIIWDKEITGSKYNGLSNINNGEIRVKSMTIRRINNFVVQNLSGWTYPVLQYMGKGTCDVQMVLESNSYIYNAHDGEHVVSPIYLLKHKLKTIDVNFVNYKKYSAYNLIKMESILCDILPLHGLILDSENIISSDNIQGLDTLSVTLRESKVENLLDRSKYKNAGTRNSAFTLSEMVSVFKGLAEHLYNGPSISPLYSMLEEVEELIIDSLELRPYMIPTYKNSGQRLSVIIRDRLSERHIARINKTTRLLLERDLNTIFIDLIKEASEGSSLAQAFVGKYRNEMINNYGSIVEDFDEHGVSDLDLPSRDTKPFFMINDKKYITAKSAYSIATAYAREVDPDGFIDAYANSVNRVALDGTSPDANIKKRPANIKADVARTRINNRIMNSGNTSEEMSEVESSSQFIKDRLRYGGEDGGPMYVNPFDFDHQTIIHSRRMVSHTEQGMNLAFPVVKVFIVEGDETSIGKQALDLFTGHNFYELKGVRSLGIGCQTDENPIDALEMVVANPNSVFTDESVHFDTYKPKRDIKNHGTEDEVRFALNKMRLRVGMRLHVKAGYSNNINELETIFNGEIVTLAGEQMMRVEAESFGRELIAYQHGDDPEKDNFFMGADTASILRTAIESDEIEHFGTFYAADIFGTEDSEARRLVASSPAGIFAHTRTKNLFSNIYYNELIGDVIYDEKGQKKGFFSSAIDFFTGSGEDDYGLDLKALIPFSDNQLHTHYPIYRATPYSILKEMEFRHPGIVSLPRWYGARQTYFFGVKEQLYVYRDLPNDIMHHKFSLAQLPRGVQDNLYNELRWHRYKPACDFHMALSETNIIKNNIKLNSDFNTVVNTQWYDDEDSIKDANWDYLEIKMDDNLKPSAHRRGEFNMPGIHGRLLAFHYSSVYLQKEAEKMYSGSLILLGNEKIKPGDYIYVNDTLRGLVGVIKVRGCTHSFDLDNGFITTVTPGCWTESSLFERSGPLFDYLQATSGAIAGHIQDKSKAANQSSITYSNANSMLRSLIEMTPDKVEELLVYGASTATMAAIFRGAVQGTAKVAAETLLFATKKTYSPVVSSAKAGSFARAPMAFKSALKAKKAGKITARLFKVARLSSLAPGPWTAVTLAGAMLLNSYWNTISLGRQPIRIKPLLLNGHPYIGGIYGYKENSIFDSWLDEMNDSWKKAKELGAIVSHAIWD